MRSSGVCQIPDRVSEQALKGAITETQEEGQHVVTLDNVIPQLRMLKSYFPLMREFWSNGLFDSMDRRYFALIDRSRGVAELLHPDLREALDIGEVFEEFREVFDRPDTKSYINKMLAFDMATLLPALLQVEDRMSMGASLESRVPLLDTRLVDLLGRISPRIKFNAGIGKHALKLATRRHPPSSNHRPWRQDGLPCPTDGMDAGAQRYSISLMTRFSGRQELPDHSSTTLP